MVSWNGKVRVLAGLLLRSQILLPLFPFFWLVQELDVGIDCPELVAALQRAAVRSVFLPFYGAETRRCGAVRVWALHGPNYSTDHSDVDVLLALRRCLRPD